MIKMAFIYSSIVPSYKSTSILEAYDPPFSSRRGWPSIWRLQMYPLCVFESNRTKDMNRQWNCYLYKNANSITRTKKSLSQV